MSMQYITNTLQSIAVPLPNHLCSLSQQVSYLMLLSPSKVEILFLVSKVEACTFVHGKRTSNMIANNETILFLIITPPFHILCYPAQLILLSIYNLLQFHYITYNATCKHIFSIINHQNVTRPSFYGNLFFYLF